MIAPACTYGLFDVIVLGAACRQAACISVVKLTSSVGSQKLKADDSNAEGATTGHGVDFGYFCIFVT